MLYIFILIIIFIIFISIYIIKNKFTIPNSKKIAILFLTRDNHKKYNLYEKFFENADKNKYNIYTHAKYPEDLTNPIFKNTIIDKYVDTKWARFSLFEAMYELVKAAYNDDMNNEYFIFISESTIPVKSFNYMYNYLTKDTRSHIEIYDGRLFQKNQLFLENYDKSQLKKGSQWVCLNRYHAKIIIDNYDMAFKLFQTDDEDGKKNNATVPDEYVIPTILHLKDKKLNKNNINKNLTYVKWNSINKTCNIINGYENKNLVKKNPCSYNKIDDKELKYLIKSELLFFRKVSENIILNEKLLYDEYDN